MEDQGMYAGVYDAALALLKDDWLKKCSFAAEFQSEWHRVLRGALRNGQSYAPVNPDAVFCVPCNFQDTPFVFHFDQSKLADWFRQDSSIRERHVFLPKELTRGMDGAVCYYDSALRYDSGAPEPVVAEGSTEIFVCSLPGFPPPLQVVYGSKYVEHSFCGLWKRKLPVFLIPAEFTPAFLGDSFEVCLYLFWMDCCIIMENHAKVSDKRLKPLLHIFRDSSMLTVKKLR